MDFARKQLEKYGWKEGEGLGRNKTGIAKALKPKLKFDTGGLGHDVFEDIHNTWWQRLYDHAAKNVVTKKATDDSVTIQTVEDSLEIITKKTKKKKKHKDTVYKDFVKTSELDHNVEKRIAEDVKEEPPVKKKKITSGICDLTDEELFKICEGRTAHKGARHGLKMNAKLARIEEQESNFMQSLEAKPEESGDLESVKVKKHKKKKKKKKDER